MAIEVKDMKTRRAEIAEQANKDPLPFESLLRDGDGFELSADLGYNHKAVRSSCTYWGKKLGIKISCTVLKDKTIVVIRGEKVAEGEQTTNLKNPVKVETKKDPHSWAKSNWEKARSRFIQYCEENNRQNDLSNDVVWKEWCKKELAEGCDVTVPYRPDNDAIKVEPLPVVEKPVSPWGPVVHEPRPIGYGEPQLPVKLWSSDCQSSDCQIDSNGNVWNIPVVDPVVDKN